MACAVIWNWLRSAMPPQGVNSLCPMPTMQAWFTLLEVVHMVAGNWPNPVR